MRKSRFSEAQIVEVLREFDAGAPAEELSRRHGIHANTIRLWRSKYAGMSAIDLSRLKQLEAENAQIQRIIAWQSVICKPRSEKSSDHATLANSYAKDCTLIVQSARFSSTVQRSANVDQGGYWLLTIWNLTKGVYDDFSAAVADSEHRSVAFFPAVLRGPIEPSTKNDQGPRGRKSVRAMAKAMLQTVGEQWLNSTSLNHWPYRHPYRRGHSLGTPCYEC